MRGEAAISVTATPAAAPRRSRGVLRIIIREPSGFRLLLRLHWRRPAIREKVQSRRFSVAHPPRAWIDGHSSLRNPHIVRVDLHAFARADCRLFVRWAHPLRK